ncbi:hypothetical protein E4U43_008158 [Claviceps pusilla]|uniref:Uncharacterized protein n=1 Tax=Claviceps pusilla TaxID=123648 RepID=A0A9P7NBL1_9HYPO|nr:hypothetical protein E4U43_008158 [Claviceps pusilla]
MTLPDHNDPLSICIPFILTHLRRQKRNPPRRPLIIGLNGVQGVGKTTLVASLAQALAGKKIDANSGGGGGGSSNIKTLVFSLDDFYLTHQDQLALAAANPGNALVQHRGEPGTHDTKLLKSVFKDLLTAQPTKIPRYDKALFSGQGDRLPPEAWTPVNQPGDEPIQVILFEGWAVGFRPLSDEDVEAKWEGTTPTTTTTTSRTLRQHRLEHLLFINDKLRDYDAVTDSLDALIHVDAEDVQHVYAWRQEQEESLRRARGDPSAGMTPEQVVRFVDGYFPAYGLYTDGVRGGVFKDRPGQCQLRLIVGRDRKVKQVVHI